MPAENINLVIFRTLPSYSGRLKVLFKYNLLVGRVAKRQRGCLTVIKMPSFKRVVHYVVKSERRFQFIFYLAVLLVAINLLLWGAVPLRGRSPIVNVSRLKLAYATILTSSEADHDAYFLSARILNYQLLHANSTSTTSLTPFLILVTPAIPFWKRKILANEGATIVEVEKLHMEGMTPLFERWRDMMVKLRLFQLTEYDRILFLDADTFLLKSLDGVFSDSAGKRRQTKSVTEAMVDEAALPDSYLFATVPEVRSTVHSYPPLTLPYFNSGFFLLSPSIQLFNYYISLLDLKGRFDTTYPEQNLLNYAHRESGNMPWSRLSYRWNINLPNMNDVKKGVASVHSKLWTDGNILQPTDPFLVESWKRVKNEMEIFYS